MAIQFTFKFTHFFWLFRLVKLLSKIMSGPVFFHLICNVGFTAGCLNSVVRTKSLQKKDLLLKLFYFYLITEIWWIRFHNSASICSHDSHRFLNFFVLSLRYANDNDVRANRRCRVSIVLVQVSNSNAKMRSFGN